ncbi:MAG: glycerate kinase [Candidatus Ornithospirochaeta sp.]|nr:glycerate kinase [Sphaerochaetaceae bacterium]MDY5523706.1 glycerate kinase [Candidatus Ornithospirochaeta sp.]
MSENLRKDADRIIDRAIKESLPDSAVRKALQEFPETKGKVVLIAVGKAAWQMADAAYSFLGNRISGGVVVTKYDHSKGRIGNLEIYEGGHPVPDENSYRGTSAAIKAVEGLGEEDIVLFLVSGGGSALFEKPLIPSSDMARLTSELLASGASITEMNTIRKRMSAVKGGKFALLCKPAKVFSIVLSDIIGDPLDMIASGPAYPDSSTREEAEAIAEAYGLTLTDEMKKLLAEETPKSLDNVETHVTGSVRELCASASRAAEELGYKSFVITSYLSCIAREAGVMMADIAMHNKDSKESLAFIMGGETVVKLTGKGKGGRNQELALSAAPLLSSVENAAVFSVGSDGTDGPTDAAGGYVDSDTLSILKAKGIDVQKVLEDNDAYHALEKCGGLVITGPTGTNVNDVSVLLIKRN